MILLRFITAILLLIPLSVYPDTGPGKLNLGTGVYFLELYDESFLSDREAQWGGVLSADYIFDDYNLLHGTYYALDSGDFDNTDIDGWEAIYYFGNGFASPGQNSTWVEAILARNGIVRMDRIRFPACNWALALVTTGEVCR